MISKNPVNVSARRALVVVALLLACCAVPSVASGSTPCWQLILNEWYGGAITHVYPKQCYTEAISHLPANVQEYSSARSDILVAESAAAKGKLPPPGVGPPSVPGLHASAPSSTSGSSSSSVPLPLIILGALAVILVIAGGAGLLWQRRHPSQPE